MSPRWIPWMAVALMVFSHAGARHAPVGAPRPWCEYGSHEYGHPAGFAGSFAVDGNLMDCDENGIPGDFDGHYEYASGGAWLFACASGCGDGGGGAGSLGCFDAYADHDEFPLVEVYDDGLSPSGSGVLFTVYADAWGVPPFPGEPACGDFEFDHVMVCVDLCQVVFPPGQDGSYHVHVHGTTGTVHASGARCNEEAWIQTYCEERGRGPKRVCAVWAAGRCIRV